MHERAHDPSIKGRGARQELLVYGAAELADMAAGYDDIIAAHARALEERLENGSFHVAVVGEFKRGKSTLLNALLGCEVLPSGVRPVTAVGIELRYGRKRPLIVAEGGEVISLTEGSDISDYVTEQGNPRNRRKVKRVIVEVESPLLESGLVLVDTPGMGSVNLHNDAEADRQLAAADGAVLVLSTDSPMTERERQLYQFVTDRGIRTFVVMNKADHHDPGELAEVLSYVEGELERVANGPTHIWCVSARMALQAARAGKPREMAGYDWPAFYEELVRFVEHDLSAVRLDSAERRLGELIQALGERVAVEAALARLDRETRRKTLEALRKSVDVERSGWEADQVLLERGVGAIVEHARSELALFAAETPRIFSERALELSARTDRLNLAAALDDFVEEVVRASFEEKRSLVQDEASRAWDTLASEMRGRAEDRVNQVRQHASSELGVELPRVNLPALADEEERFSYHFTPIESTEEQLAAILRLALPGPLLRQLMLRRAGRRLRDHLDKHAGRAGYDLEQRLRGVSRRLARELGVAVEQAASLVSSAAEQVQAERSKAEDTLGAAMQRREVVVERLASLREALSVPRYESPLRSASGSSVDG